jgi:hypothetical protein
MNPITEQASLLDERDILGQISDDVVLVELSPPPTAKQSTTGPGNPGLADKFESMADLMQVQIDAKLDHDRQTNTPKRMAQAMSARVEGERLKRTQAALRLDALGLESAEG